MLGVSGSEGVGNEACAARCVQVSERQLTPSRFPQLFLKLQLRSGLSSHDLNTGWPTFPLPIEKILPNLRKDSSRAVTRRVGGTTPNPGLRDEGGIVVG